ncbi:MAG TPA: hypothetical protein VEZ11_15290 [Thermoanaerobaculia bacterium]|nr:hypothetical protein [Thermoanaerobaculia bacterium]
MNDDVMRRLEAFLRPYYQDLDGVSRFGEVERIAAIARSLMPSPSPDEQRDLDLLLLFQGLPGWLDRMGHRTRTQLALGGAITEEELRRTAAAVKRLDAPTTPAETAVAAARVIDAAGVRGLAERFAHARREGLSVVEIAREELARPATIPEWMPDAAVPLIRQRRARREAMCRAIVEEG